MAKLTFVLEDGQEVVIPLTERITIGSDENNDVMVDDERISPQHAELMQNADGSIQVFDLNSNSGTYVNGARQQSCTLLHGDRLAFGPLEALLDLEEDANSTSTQTSPAVAKSPEKPGPPASAAPNGETENHSLAVARRAKEEELARLQAAGRQAEVVHSEWLAAIRALASEHDEKTAALEQVAAQFDEKTAALQKLTAQHDETASALQRLAASESAAQQEIEALAAKKQQATDDLAEKTTALQQLTASEVATRQQLAALAAHNEQELTQQRQIRQEHDLAKQQLAELRRQLAEIEARSKEHQTNADAELTRLNAAKQALGLLNQQRADLESRIQQLGNTEEKLTQALTRNLAADAQHAALATAIAALVVEQQRAGSAVADLENRLTVLQETHRKTDAAAAAAQTNREHTEASLQQVQTELAGATQQLEATRAQHADLETQCQKLATVGQQLTQAEERLAGSEKRRNEVQSALDQAGSRLTMLQTAVEKIATQENAAKERLDTLREREKKLRAELDAVATSEQNARARLEEIRQLTIKEQKDRAVQQKELTLGIDSARRELTSLQARLSPLRNWQEAMNQRYTRLAAMPQDSREARELLLEIEAENAALFHLITAPHLRAPRIMHVEFARLSPISGVPMKSERSRKQTTMPVAPK